MTYRVWLRWGGDVFLSSEEYDDVEAATNLAKSMASYLPTYCTVGVENVESIDEWSGSVDRLKRGGR